MKPKCQRSASLDKMARLPESLRPCAAAAAAAAGSPARLETPDRWPPLCPYSGHADTHFPLPGSSLPGSQVTGAGSCREAQSRSAGRGPTPGPPTPVGPSGTGREVMASARGAASRPFRTPGGGRNHRTRGAATPPRAVGALLLVRARPPADGDRGAPLGHPHLQEQSGHFLAAGREGASFLSHPGTGLHGTFQTECSELLLRLALPLHLRLVCPCPRTWVAGRSSEIFPEEQSAERALPAAASRRPMCACVCFTHTGSGRKA